jgi:hypothetical protein
MASVILGSKNASMIFGFIVLLHKAARAARDEPVQDLVAVGALASSVHEWSEIPRSVERLFDDAEALVANDPDDVALLGDAFDEVALMTLPTHGLVSRSPQSSVFVGSL